MTGTVELLSTLDQQSAGNISFLFTTAEGATLRVPLSVTVTPLTPPDA